MFPAAYEKAQTIGPLKADIEQLVPAVLARAGFEKRRIESGDGGSSTVSLQFLGTD